MEALFPLCCKEFGFLVGMKRLYKRVYPLAGQSVHWLVGLSVTLLLFGLLEETYGCVSGLVYFLQGVWVSAPYRVVTRSLGFGILLLPWCCTVQLILEVVSKQKYQRSKM